MGEEIPRKNVLALSMGTFLSVIIEFHTYPPSKIGAAHISQNRKGPIEMAWIKGP